MSSTIAEPRIALPKMQQRGRAVVICTGRRTGSTLLSDGLRSTGRIGRPAEFFDIHQGNRNFWINRLGIQDDSEYFEKVIKEGTTPNGVFGLKLMWYQVPSLVYAYNMAYGTNPTDPRQKKFHRILNERFLGVDYLWLRRRNKIAQGISDYRAVQSDVWRLRRGTDVQQANAIHQVPFNFAGIHRHVKLAENFDQHWQEYFIAHRLKATIVIYEELIEEFEPTVRAICKILELDQPPLHIGTPAWERQADELSEEWEREYLKMRAFHQEQARLVQTPPQAGESPAKKPAAPATPAPDQPLPLIAYDLKAQYHMSIVPATSRRAWMDATPQHFAYRCLPLTIANQHGWFILTPCRIEAIWNGGGNIADIEITYPEGERRRFASSHFGSGVLTFSLEHVFRTPPGYNLYARGPANMPRDGIFPLEGIIETDWTEATFTMNWLFTRPNHKVVFEKDDPICQISPIMRGEVERFAPEIRYMESNPELYAGYQEWSKSRASFNEDLKKEGSDAKKAGWQRHYVRGETVTRAKASEHQTSLDIKEFIDNRGREGK